MNNIKYSRKIVYFLFSVGAAIVLFGTLLPPVSAIVDNNLQIHGNLIEAPCILDVGEQAQIVDFGTVIKKGLYHDGRSINKQFHITLKECKVSKESIASFTFSGSEDLSLPGYLAVTGVTGIGIGLAMTSVNDALVDLPLNKPISGFKLESGNNVYELVAWVQGEPQAIAQQTISSGDFVATMNIEVNYQ